jgi:hypothetical protein
MRLFGKNTKGLFIGIPEAESESNFKATVKLEEVFEDFLSALPELETEKFIITGRKGNGKSALGQVISQKAKNSPNEFCCFIRKSDIDLEELVQLSKDLGHNIEKEVLFKWIILTKILSLITQNEAVQHLKEIKTLRDFLNKNTGYVNINRYEIKGIIEKNGFEIHIEKLLRFFRFKKNREIQLSGQKAPFYKLIPHLENAILSVLDSEEDKLQGNIYKLIFDDLDIEFKAEKKESVDSILNLIRIARHYNNNFFSENEIDAKVIILLRDDISDVLIKRSADMAKIFSSGSIPLYWYEHDLYRRDENLIPLKKFINKRIAKAFERKDFEYVKTDPWSSLINTNDELRDSSFKYIIDHTFQSPRDLILFFQDLSKYEFRIPLGLSDLNTLIGKYAQKCKLEIDNALAIYFSPSDIDNIFRIFKSLSELNDFTYDNISKEIEKYEFNKSTDNVMEILYDYSLIGNKASNGNQVYFKYREEESDTFDIDFTKPFVLHRIISIYSKNKKLVQ